MDFKTLTRKELQVLCKAHGIPANKTNVFMQEALASKRIPLSEMDRNREQKGSGSLPAEQKRRNGVTGPTMNVVKAEPKVEQREEIAENQKFKNNFLRRGTRKDTLAPQKSAALGSVVGPNSAASRADICSEPNVAQPELRPADLRIAAEDRLDIGRLDAKRPGGQTALSSDLMEVDGAPPGIECRDTFSRLDDKDDGKEHAVGIAERVRYQVDAALCSKVVHGIAHRLPDQSVVTRIENPGTCHGGDCHEALDQHEALAQSAPEMFAEEPTVLPTPHSHCDAVDPSESPPLRLSPLQLCTDKIGMMMEKLRKFWDKDVTA